MSQPIWTPGQGFGNQPAKKVIIKPKAFGFSLKEKPEDLEALNKDIHAFVKVNEPLLGFIAWNGYEIENQGAGVVYCNAEGGIEADSIGAQYVPAATILPALRQQLLPEATVLAMEQQLQTYDPRKTCFVIVSLHGLIFALALEGEDLTPPQAYELMTHADEEPSEEETNA